MKTEKKILDWWSESQGESFSRDFWPAWLFELSEEYETSDSNLRNLLIKVDVIPISMALSQAAIESGWSTSRYLREGTQFTDNILLKKIKELFQLKEIEEKIFH